MLKGGVIGFGGVGQSLTRYINEKSDRAQIVAACNRGQMRLDLATDEYGLRGTHDVEELCSWDLDFVLVVSTNYAHKQQVLAAANAGLGVFCEKPIATNVPDAVEMIEAIEKAGVPNVVNYSLRYMEMADTLKKFIDNGELGEILSVSFERCRAFGLHCGGARHMAITDPSESGGWIVHHACHQIDFIYYMLGGFDTAYATTRSTVPDIDSEEMIFGNGLLKSGVMYHVGDSIAKAAYSQLVVSGTKATFVSQGVGDYTMTRLRKEGDAGGDDVMSFTGGWILGISKAHRPVEHFFDCMEGKAEPVATLRDSLESLRVAAAMKESSQTGKLIHMDDFTG